MGWFSKIKKAVSMVVETVTEIVETVWEAVTWTFEAAIDKVMEAVAAVADAAGEAAIKAVMDTVDDIFADGYVPNDPDLSRFDPVVSLAEQVQSTTVKSADWTGDETVEIRDAVIAAQIGYADQSELIAAGAVDADGYVTDASVIYEGSGWLDGMAVWASDRFEVIRVLEDASSSLLGGYEANVTLSQNLDTGDYYISIGGTASYGDVLSDLNLVLSEDTGASEDAITNMIAQFFEDDIEAGATVNLTGHSLGGAEAVLQYRDAPELFDHVYAIQSVGIGGFDGTYYDQEIWDGVGDSNITEITGNDAGTDFNDLVTYWGHVGAGTTYHVEDVILADDEEAFFSDLELVDSHLLDNLWASLPGGQDPIAPEAIASDSFDFV